MRDSQNRELLLRKYSIDTRSLVLAQQIHKAEIARVCAAQIGKTIQAVDGLIYAEKERKTNITLGIRTADCIPLIAVDIDCGFSGALHAGWRGVFAELPKKLLTRHSNTGGKIKNIRIFIGPHIRSCCYTVSTERKKIFAEKFNLSCSFNPDNGCNLDMIGIVTDQLLPYGVAHDQIIDAHICTSCSRNDYYSYRNSNTETFGEQLALINTRALQ